MLGSHMGDVRLRASSSQFVPGLAAGPSYRVFRTDAPRFDSGGLAVVSEYPEGTWRMGLGKTRAQGFGLR
jgi:hypothetical protein